MTAFEKKICEAFLNRFTGEQKTMRLRSASVFPEFDAAAPDEKASFLEAAETLERQGLISLNWEKHNEGERLKTLTCLSMGKLFAAAEIKDPKTEAEDVRSMIKNKLPAFEKFISEQSRTIFSFLNFLADHFNTLDVGRGMHLKEAEDFISLLDFLLKEKFQGDIQQTIALSTRALSVKLYNDSKRLEKILDLAAPLFTQAKKQNQIVPDLSFLERSFPETLIAGKLIFKYRTSVAKQTDQPLPLVNTGGHILGFPLLSAESIETIKTLKPKERMTVLTIENKETFYALAASLSGYDCFLYTGGYPNRAAAAFIKILSASGFSFYHSGDLDPDGILILQNVYDLAGKNIIPVGMDVETFNRCLPWARPLHKTMLQQTGKIRDDIKTLPGIAKLLERILETERGVEQEVIDYGRTKE